MDVYMQHGQGRSMDMDMQHGHGHAEHGDAA
jgi:hypothetical protein